LRAATERVGAVVAGGGGRDKSSADVIDIKTPLAGHE